MSLYEISKSSLLSLKAEILRKQEELAKVKVENVEKIKLIKKKSLEFKNKGVEDRHLNDLDNEEQDLLKLSRSKLEAKSKLYDQLSNNAPSNEEVNRKYLVQFDKKSKTYEETSDTNVDSDGEERHLSDYDEQVDPSEEWVEYTDCLGRSRKCLRKDLEYFMSKDADLKDLAQKRHQTSSDNNAENAEQPAEKETNSKTIETDNEPNHLEDSTKEMISGDMRKEMLRKKWEEEEEELRNKTNIHYQNVLFNEARQHGVGYYAFSRDEEERARQQEALNQLRAETEQQQKKAQDLKALREKQLAARMRAARNRKRARLGLPPEEDEPEQTQNTRNESEEDLKKKEEEEKQKEIEKMLAEARKHHVRPWDIGKEGVNEFYQMTQEEWNEKKRQERPTEFAPPTSYNKKDREFSSMKTVECSLDEGDKSLRFSSKTNKLRNKNKKLRNINPYKYSDPVELEDSNCKETTENPCSTNNNSPDNDDDDDDCLMKDYMQSQAFDKCENSVYEPENPTSDVEDTSSINQDEIRNVSSTMAPTPIVNELEVDDFDDRLMADYQRTAQNVTQEDDCRKRKGVEISPPATFEYYGHIGTKKMKNSVEPINIAQSIEAGLKFLRNQTERKRHRRVDDL